MTGVLINTAAVLLGSAAGNFFQKGISGRIIDGVMMAMGLCVLYIGIAGALAGSQTLVLILSMILGTALGTAADLDGKLNALGTALERRLGQGGQGGIARGFVTGSLVMCIGAMATIGALDAGLKGDNTILLTKSVMDLITSTMLAASLGTGVFFSAASILLYEGGIALLAGALAPVFTQEMIQELSCTGSVLILALGLNMVGAAKIKVADGLPAIFLTPAVYWALRAVGLI